MPGPKGYFEVVPKSDEPTPPGAFDVITFSNLTTDVSVVGRNNDHSVKVGTLKQDPIALNATVWYPAAAATAVSATLRAGAPTGAGNGGSLTLSAGSLTNGDGGNVFITATSGVGVNRVGGSISITAAASTGNGSAGSITMNGGSAGTTGTGGSVSITAGFGGTVSGTGGQLSLQGGSASATTGASGGNVSLTGGNPDGAGLRGLITFTGSLTLNTAEVTLNSNQDNYTGADGFGVLKINCTGNMDLTGLANPVSGRQLFLYNTGASIVTLKHDVTSTAANRFFLPGATDLAIAQYTGVILEYAPTITRWIVVGMSVSTSSGTPGLANVVYVSKAGVDATGVRGNISKPFLTIGAAITASSAGDVIMVGPGTYAETVAMVADRELQGSGMDATIISSVNCVLTGGASCIVGFANFSTGELDFDASAKTGGSIVSLKIQDVEANSPTTWVGRSNGQDRANISNLIFVGVGLTCTNVNGDYVHVRTDAVLSITNNTAMTVNLVACNVLGGTTTLAGSGNANVAGCLFFDLACNNAGTYYLNGSSIQGNFAVNNTATVTMSGCTVVGTVTLAAGTTFSQNGCTFSNSGYLASAAPGTLNLTYWGGTLVVTAAATATLPAVARKGYYVTIKNGNSVASGNNVTVGRNGNNIDGGAADAVLGPLQSATFIGDGTDWWAT